MNVASSFIKMSSKSWWVGNNHIVQNSAKGYKMLVIFMLFFFHDKIIDNLPMPVQSNALYLAVGLA